MPIFELLPAICVKSLRLNTEEEFVQTYYRHLRLEDPFLQIFEVVKEPLDMKAFLNTTTLYTKKDESASSLITLKSQFY